ncbi:MAG TPA: cytochrome c-type biogenesis CcmF C-terminal domain-containing protein, partial [Chloroflexota bacterium]|nr:cytochrome c-type biogenesis CcmF C-terminal domain-containing protein [Chloroflexota bacterium]
GTLDALASRESVFLLNNLLLVALTFTVLLGTLFPLIAEATTGQRLSVGAPYFNRVAVPIALALLFLMGVGPLLPWGAARLEETLERLVLPAAAAVAMLALLVLAGVRGTGALAFFGLATFVASATWFSFMRDLRARQHSTGEPWFQAVPLLVRANPRRYAGYLAHVGVLFVVVGIAASQSFSSSAERTLNLGQTMRLDGYTMTFADVQAHRQPSRIVVAAGINVGQGDKLLGSLWPSVNYYPNSVEPVITPAVHLAATQDVYLVVRAIDKNGRWVTLQAYVKPLVSWIWFGGGVIGLGALMALTPARKRRRSEVIERRAARAEPAEALT